MKSRIIVATLAACLLVTVAIGWQALSQRGPSVTVYKSPTCGCCTKWADMLKEAGFEVDAQNVTNMREIKEEYGIDRAISSCHTAIVEGGYIVEGHVPIDLIKKLVEEKPDIKGLAVPGMPIGSPGMEGPNAQPYDVLAFGEEGTSVYATITP